MNSNCSIIFNSYSFLILLILFFHGRKLVQKDSLRDRLYMLILYMTMIMLGLDTLTHLAGNGVLPVIYAGHYIICLMSTVLPSLWVAYTHFWVFRDEIRTRKLFWLLLIINALHAAIILVLFFPKRELTYYCAIIPAVMMLSALAMVLANRRTLEKRSFISLIFTGILPLTAFALQIMFPGFSLILNSVVLSLIIVFLNIQAHYLYTDHLTGVNNRKRLDLYLKEKVYLSTPEKSFSAILLDINNFKYINDTYGHDIGDDALVTAVKLLKSCIRHGDFIARFGGDEFLLILDITDEKDLEKLASRINSCAEKYNNSDMRLYEISFSMGYAVYDYSSRMSPEEFLKQIDTLMYENKHDRSASIHNISPKLC